MSSPTSGSARGLLPVSEAITADPSHARLSTRAGLRAHAASEDRLLAFLP